VLAKLVPIALFVVLLEWTGTQVALVAVLAWSLLVLGYRALTGGRLPGLVLLAAVTLTARTIGSLLTGSTLVYFVPPALTTFAVGLAFAVSVPLGIPLAQRLASDIIPFDETTAAHPVLRRFFVRLSLVWAGASMVNTAVTLWLLASQSTGTFVVVKSVLGPASAAVAIGGTLVWQRAELARTGTRLVWQRHAVVPAVAQPQR
jgi:hypothetical protein